MSTLLLTGGAGYIGSHTVHACTDAGLNVVVLDDLSTGWRACLPANATFVQGDVGDPDLVRGVIERHGVKAIIHFAGSIIVPESVAQPAKYYENNTVKSLRLARTAVACGIEALVFSSTAAVYAPTTESDLGEDSPKGPLSPYGHSKLMTEQMLADIAAADGLRVGVLRYFNVAGCDPHGRTGQCSPNATHLIKVAVQAALGQRQALPVFGTDYDTPDGTCVRDYIHVSDLAEAHVLAVRHLLEGGESFTANCGYGRGASVLEVIRALEAVHGAALPIAMQPRRPGDAPRVVADAARIRKLLPWRPRFEQIEEIVASALQWEKALIAHGGQPPLRD